MISVGFSENRLIIDSSHVVEFEHKIETAFESNGVVVVMLDPDCFTSRGLHKNLIGFDRDGKMLWQAELPRYSKFDIWKRKGEASEASDIYWRIEEKFPLVASSFSSYTCTIDEATGKIKSAEFYK